MCNKRVYFQQQKTKQIRHSSSNTTAPFVCTSRRVSSSDEDVERLAFRSMCLILQECNESKKPEESNFLSQMMSRLQMGGHDDFKGEKEPNFLEQNLELFMDMCIDVCDTNSKGSFYHAQRVLRVCIQEHTDRALTYLSKPEDITKPPPLYRYFQSLLRHVHEPGAIDMLIDLLCLPPRTSESSALNNVSDQESQDNLMMMMMMQPTTELLSSFTCSSVVKHKYYKAVSDSEVLISLVCRVADSRLLSDHADASADAFEFVLKHLSGDCDGAIALESFQAKLHEISLVLCNGISTFMSCDSGKVVRQDDVETSRYRLAETRLSGGKKRAIPLINILRSIVIHAETDAVCLFVCVCGVLPTPLIHLHPHTHNRYPSPYLQLLELHFNLL